MSTNLSSSDYEVYLLNVVDEEKAGSESNPISLKGRFKSVTTPTTSAIIQGAVQCDNLPYRRSDKDTEDASAAGHAITTVTISKNGNIPERTNTALRLLGDTNIICIRTPGI